eukprot:m.353675 g.353675  ORF g.353675 m.353675 type:complete len:338 (+) comp16818_c0_seq1:487-1500(+)
MSQTTMQLFGYDLSLPFVGTSPVATALACVGATACACATWRLTKFAWRVFLRPGYNLFSRYGGETGKTWAVVTGASDGIGEEFAYQLAAQGFNICLVSRTQSKLDRVNAELLRRYPNIETCVFCVDLGVISDEDLNSLLTDFCARNDVAVLINNAGVAGLPNKLSDFDASDDTRAQLMHTVNVTAYFTVLRTVLPFLAQREARSGCINVSSASALAGLPLNGVYAGTKAYARFLSMSVAREVDDAVDILCYAPLFIATNMTRLRPSMTVPDSATAAASALRCLGHDMEVVGFWAHELMMIYASWFPGSFGSSTRKSMEGTRRRVLAKLQQKAQVTKE